METELLVSKVLQYGRDEYKPECEKSRLFADLLKQKHLTRGNVETIKALGYTFKIKQEKL